MALKATVQFCAIIVCFIVNESRSLGIDYLGSYLNHKDYNKRDVCSSKVCLLDNDRLVYAATRNSSIEPCKDIQTFASGEFLKHRVPSDRYVRIGFQNDVSRITKQRQRIILNQPVKDDDPRMFKIMKKTFKKCVNSDYIRKKRGDEMISHLQQFGGSPLVTNGSWNENDFTIRNMFNFESFHSMRVFLDQLLSRCKDPRSSNVDMLCFKSDNKWKFSNDTETDMTPILKDLKLDASLKQTGIKNLIDFLQLKEPIQRLEFTKDKSEVFKVRELSIKFPELDLDWLSIINALLLKQSQISEEDEILVKNPDLLKKLLTLLATVEKREIANVFATTFFYSNRRAVVVYSLTRKEIAKRGTKQSYHRYEQCIFFLERTMRSALEVLTAQKYYTPSLQAAGKELIQEGVVDVINDLRKSNVSEDLKNILISKLETINIIAMFPDDILNATKIQEMYEDIPISGDEPLVVMYLAMKKYGQKLYRAKSTDWVKFLDKTLSNLNSKYDLTRNTMYIPSRFFLYPFFHPERSRFFNMATMYLNFVGTIRLDLKQYYKKELNEIVFTPNAILADENYERWEANGGKERQLSAFKLTNRQMFWVCTAYAYTAKHHNRALNPNVFSRLQTDYLHVRIKSLKNFRDAFDCEEMTDEEKISLEKYEKLSKLL